MDDNSNDSLESLYFFPSKNSEEATSSAINTSFPGLYPDISIELVIKSRHSLLLEKFGAKPPSSPTEIENFFT